MCEALTCTVHTVPGSKVREAKKEMNEVSRQEGRALLWASMEPARL